MKRSTLRKVQIKSPPSNNRLEATFETQFLLKLIRNTNHYSILNSLRERRIKTGSDQEKILVTRTQAFFRKEFPLTLTSHCSLFRARISTLDCCGLKKYTVIFLKEKVEFHVAFTQCRGITFVFKGNKPVRSASRQN